MKVLVSDYDKTLDINIDENIKSINTFRKEGNIFVIATGRSLLDISKKIWFLSQIKSNYFKII